MADVDTPAKRRSVQGYSIGILPAPDGAITAPDRAHAAWLYAGFTYASPSAIEAFAAYLYTRFHLHHNLRPFN